jgi:hypothetical protein
MANCWCGCTRLRSGWCGRAAILAARATASSPGALDVGQPGFNRCASSLTSDIAPWVRRFFMTRYAFSLCCLLLLVLATITCGSNRQLQTVTLSPPSADAHSFPNGQVNFAATGTFSKPPSPMQLSSKDVTWCAGTSSGVCAGNINIGANVDPNGVAQCQTGFSGTVTVLAGTGGTTSMPDTGSQLKIFGSAQLTCP